MFAAVYVAVNKINIGGKNSLSCRLSRNPALVRKGLTLVSCYLRFILEVDWNFGAEASSVLYAMVLLRQEPFSLS